MRRRRDRGVGAQQHVRDLSFEGVLNFTAEGRLYYRIGAHLHRYTLLDVDGSLPRSMSTPSRDRLSGNPVDDFDI